MTNRSSCEVFLWDRVWHVRKAKPVQYWSVQLSIFTIICKEYLKSIQFCVLSDLIMDVLPYTYEERLVWWYRCLLYASEMWRGVLLVIWYCRATLHIYHTPDHKQGPLSLNFCFVFQTLRNSEEWMRWKEVRGSGEGTLGLLQLQFRLCVLHILIDACNYLIRFSFQAWI